MIEAYGVKGMKSTPWRKTFSTAEKLNAWCEKHSAEVHAVSDSGDDPMDGGGPDSPGFAQNEFPIR
jgi:hypothetical protein